MAKKGKEVKQEEQKREGWGNKAEFYLATLGYCVGMGAMTRFPYLVAKNGGGAFLIPFVIVMAICGAPLFYLETILGQFSGLSPLKMWNLCPAFKGLGVSVTALSGLVSLYYMPLTWSIFYFVASCASDPVPWATCGSWSTDSCWDNQTVKLYQAMNITNTTLHSPTEEFWNEYILGISDGLENMGGVQWQLLVAHAIAWLFVFLATMGGASTAGKVVYVTATLPYALLTALLIFGCTLPGSVDGILYFLVPDFNKLLDPMVWVEATIQVIYQHGPCWGGLITLSSYNKFHNKCYWDAISITFMNFFTSIYAGLAIFSILGNMAYEQDVDVDTVSDSGPGLAFVAYPNAISQMPLSPMWSCIFFLTIMTIGIDSQFGMFDTLVSGFMDTFPVLRRYHIPVTAGFAVICFCCGIPFCMQAGMYVYQIFDWYVASLTFATVGTLECLVICYIYGINRFSDDAFLMFGRRPNVIVKLFWMVITPCIMATLFIGIWNLETPAYNYTGYEYPEWAVTMGWIAACISFAPTPVVFIYVLVRNSLRKNKTFKEKMRLCFYPRDTWLPNEPSLVEEYKRKYYGYTGADDNNENIQEPPKYHEMKPMSTKMAAVSYPSNPSPSQYSAAGQSTAAPHYSVIGSNVTEF